MANCPVLVRYLKNRNIRHARHAQHCDLISIIDVDAVCH